MRIKVPEGWEVNLDPVQEQYFDQYLRMVTDLVRLAAKEDRQTEEQEALEEVENAIYLLRHGPLKDVI